jgi:tyrosinase
VSLAAYRRLPDTDMSTSNIDRLFALYQVQNPDTWLEPSNVGTNGNVFIEDDSTVDADTPLLPFRKTPDSFWTTNEARDTTVFGYAYPETRSADQSAAQAAVSRLYSGSTRARLTEQIGPAQGHFMLNEDRTFTDWVIKISADTRKLPPTFVVQFSLVGDFSSDPVKEIGMWSILMPMDHNKTEHGGRQEGVVQRRSESNGIVEGSVGITANLIDTIWDGALDTLRPEDVYPFLKNRLAMNVYSVRPCSVVIWHCADNDTGRSQSAARPE